MALPSGVRIPPLPFAFILMMLEFRNPIPVLVIADKKKGYALYVTSGGTFDNDLWCVVLCDGGVIRHYTSNQLLMQHNGTFDITKLT